jgi:hypothetical protein
MFTHFVPYFSMDPLYTLPTYLPIIDTKSTYQRNNPTWNLTITKLPTHLFTYYLHFHLVT